MISHLHSDRVSVCITAPGEHPHVSTLNNDISSMRFIGRHLSEVPASSYLSSIDVWNINTTSLESIVHKMTAVRSFAPTRGVAAHLIADSASCIVRGNIEGGLSHRSAGVIINRAHTRRLGAFRIFRGVRWFRGLRRLGRLRRVGGIWTLGRLRRAGRLWTLGRLRRVGRIWAVGRIWGDLDGRGDLAFRTLLRSCQQGTFDTAVQRHADSCSPKD